MYYILCCGETATGKGLWWWKGVRLGRGVFTLNTESKDGGAFREGRERVQ